jgi:curved DNA-binding protein
VHTDYYSLLGVSRSATADEIKAAYRRRAQRLHPDISSDPGAEERFKELTRAYSVLRDPDARVRYEIEAMERELEVREQQLNSVPPVSEPPAHRTGSAAPSPGTAGRGERGDRQGPAAGRASGLFRRFARSNGGREAIEGGPVAGDDYEVVAEVTLEEAVRGGSVTLTFAVPERGVNGAKREAVHTIELQLPKLARDAQRLRVRGEGGPGVNGGPKGDLYVEIAYKPHWLFRVRDDGEVWFYLPIAPWEAVLGAIIEIPTLDKPFRVHVPAGATSGQTFRLPGRGLPRADGGRTDLLACLRIITPETPTEQERQLYLQLARASRFNPRRGFG